MAVERGLVVGFSGQPHYCYQHYPTARFRSPLSYMVSDEPYPNRSRRKGPCCANLHKRGLAQSPYSCDRGQRHNLLSVLWHCSGFVANSKYKIQALFKDPNCIFQAPKSSTKSHILDADSKFWLQCDTEVYCTVLTNTVMIKGKFQNLLNLNSRTFQGFSSTFKHLICFQALSRTLKFLFQIQAFSRIYQAPYEPCTVGWAAGRASSL